MPHGSPSVGVPNQLALYGIPQNLDEYCLQVCNDEYIVRNLRHICMYASMIVCRHDTSESGQVLFAGV